MYMSCMCKCKRTEPNKKRLAIYTKRDIQTRKQHGKKRGKRPKYTIHTLKNLAKLDGATYNPSELMCFEINAFY